MREVRLSETEIIEALSEYHLKLLLKEKGFPFVGIINLELDPNYIYTRWDDLETGETVFTFTKIK